MPTRTITPGRRRSHHHRGRNRIRPAAVLDDGSVCYDGSFTLFDPPNDWSDAMFAAEKCGLFDEATHRAIVEKNSNGDWCVSFFPNVTSRELDGRTNASGPRAICEAILAVTRKGEA